MTDIQLNYIQKGQGQVLIFLHGNGEDLTHFEKQIEYFSKKYCVYAVDTRGHGKSPRGSAPFTISQFAEDLNEFMLECGIDRASIVGFSDGANIAMVFAIKYPDKVDRLVLNGGNLYFRGLNFSVRLSIELEYIKALLFTRKGPGRQTRLEMLRLMINDPNIAPEQLKAITASTLVLVGSRDMVKLNHSILILKMLPDGCMYMIPGTHFLVYEKPDEFNKAVSDFLQLKRENA